MMVKKEKVPEPVIDAKALVKKLIADYEGVIEYLADK